MIAVVDYRMGNLKSVERGLRSVGADARITSDPAEIAAAEAVVLPGVGAFGDAMASMNNLGETDAILSAIADGKPFLGICLGQHLLFSDGVEGAPEGGTIKGMGLIEGTVVRIPNHDAEGNLYKIPHVGWNNIENVRSPLLQGLDDRDYVYYVHSYYAELSEEFTIGTSHYSTDFSAFLHRDNYYAMQAHPEKSSLSGEKILTNFLNL